APEDRVERGHAAEACVAGGLAEPVGGLFPSVRVVGELQQCTPSRGREQHPMDHHECERPGALEEAAPREANEAKHDGYRVARQDYDQVEGLRHVVMSTRWLPRLLRDCIDEPAEK